MTDAPGDMGGGDGGQGNPDGKGLRGFLRDEAAVRPRGVAGRSKRQLLADYFTSMLVLSAEFSYAPTVGAHNFLYYTERRWTLSLIGPAEWSADRRAGFVATCVLQRDRTWSIEPSSALVPGSTAAVALQQFYQGFADALDTDVPLEELLPYYAPQFAYHARLGAHALSQSLRAGMTLGNQRGIAAREWLLALPPPSDALHPDAGGPQAADADESKD